MRNSKKVDRLDAERDEDEEKEMQLGQKIFDHREKEKGLSERVKEGKIREEKKRDRQIGIAREELMNR